MKPQFQRLLQIGIVVENVEESIECYEKQFGIGPWRVNTVDKTTFPHLRATSNGNPTQMEIKCAFCDAYGMELELIEPLCDCSYRTWLKTHGPGIHHLAFITKDELDTVLNKCEEITGEQAWLRGVEEKLGMNFAYLDLTKQLGFFAEIYGEDRSGQAGHDF